MKPAVKSAMSAHAVLLGVVLVSLVAIQSTRLEGQSPSFRFLTLAGRPAHGSADGPGASAMFFQPQGIAIDPSGVIYVADTSNHVIRRIGTDGVVSTMAGLAGTPGSTNGTSTSARFNSPKGVVSDGAGTLYVTDNNGVRKIAPDGTVSTLSASFTGTGNRGIALDGSGNLFVANGYQVYKVVIATGATSVFVGAFAPGYVDATGPNARFNIVSGLVSDASGNLFVVDVNNYRIRKITPAAVVTTVATLIPNVATTDGAYGIAIDASGLLYVANSVTDQILSATQAGVVTVLAGTSEVTGTADGSGAAARFNFPQGIASDSTGTLYVADTLNNTIRKVATGGAVTTIAGVAGGGPGNADGTSTRARFNGPRGVAVASTGTVYVADYSNCTIRSITPGGVTQTFAGTVAATPAAACGSLDATGTSAKFSFPAGVVVDGSQNVFVADTSNNAIRKITSAGVVTTFAGLAGTQGSLDATGTAARFNVPQGIAIDAAGNLYVADTGNATIRMITSAGVVTTLAGTAGQSGYTDATGAAAKFSSPTGVAVDASGNVYVADQGNNVIRKITSAGVVTTLAGNTSGFTGLVDATGTSARFSSPKGVAVDGSGNVYVADFSNNAIRKVTSAGVVTTMSGSVQDYVDGLGTAGRFNQPYGIAIDSAGNLYVADAGNNVIRLGLLAPAAPAFTTSPTDKTVDAGTNATFTVVATGNLAPSLQWQVSIDRGGTWTDLAESSPYSGTTTATLTIAGTASLNGYRYRAVATNASGTATSTSATLTINSVTTTPLALRFGATKSGASITAVTPAQTVTVLFPGAAAAWTAVSNQTWAQVTGGSQTGNGQFTVAVVNPGNVIGTSTSLSATITITPVGTLAPVLLPVTLTVDQTGVSTVGPVGQMDTPAQNAVGVVGAISVTGWVVDDVGIASVKVYRNCLAAEPQANCQTGIVAGVPVVYIADGLLVPGARPDVEAAFPTYPAANQAGWGVQVLTNMLPRTTGTFAAYGGEGPVTFYAIATDIEGHTKLLSRAYTDTTSTPTTITMDNDTIAKPFGAIDTPGQGGAVSGTIPNFGWVLTPDSDKTANSTDILMPTDGSTMNVFIDGVSAGTVHYNQCRGNVGNPVPAGLYCNDDVANIFGNATPQAVFTTRTANVTLFRNLDSGRAAIGSFDINTTTLTNGMHSLAWGVTDSAGRTEGIGSRNMFVLNTGADALVSGDAASQAQALWLAPATIRGSVSALPAGLAAGMRVMGRTGFSLTTPFEEIVATEAGVRSVQLADLGRVELQFGSGVDTGYLVANGTLRDLPAGSHLDTATGTFTWAPMPGYFGTYHLAFVRGPSAGLGAGSQIPIDVTIRPIASADAGVSEIRMNVDVPSDHAVVHGPVTIAGWALDPQAWTGSGISAVHVWAYRRDAPSTGPQFVGAAGLQAARPDVAAAFGAQFDRAGFALTTSALVPGEYDLVVYAWCERTGRWEDARSVTVSIR